MQAFYLSRLPSVVFKFICGSHHVKTYRDKTAASVQSRVSCQGFQLIQLNRDVIK